jgi:ankyrin repeat protein
VGNPLQLAAAILALAFLIGTAWCQEHWGTYDVMTGNRSCGTAPRAIKQWAGTHQERRPTERPDLEAWVARNRDSINAQYTAPCQTPLHLAARFGRDDLAAVLLDAGADPNAGDKHGDRPLHLAAEYGHVLVATLLLRRGASLEATGSSNRTALHAAADGLSGTSDLEGRLQVATALIARGANVNAQMRGNGFTPLWYATTSRSTAIADLLRASGGRGDEGQRVQ